MKKKLLHAKESVLGIVLGIMLLSSISAVYALPTFKVEPQTTIEVEIGQTFTVNVTLVIPEGENITNLYGWIIRLGFNGTILECKGASLLPGHPFEGKGFSSPIDIREDFVLYQCSVNQIGDAVNVTETVLLCQIEFNGTGLGVSPLEFEDVNQSGGTYLLDNAGEDIEVDVIDGQPVSVISEFQPLIVLFMLIIVTITVLTLRKKYYKKAAAPLLTK